MPDLFANNFVTTLPDGTISFNFQGTIQAQGITFTAWDSDGSGIPFAQAQIKWLRSTDGALLATIYAQRAPLVAGNVTIVEDVPAPDAGNDAEIQLSARNLSTASFARIRLVCQDPDASGAGKFLQLDLGPTPNNLSAVLLDDLQQSQFLQLPSLRTAAAGQASVIGTVAVVQIVNGTVTYTPGAATVKMNVEAAGGGGAGGGAAATAAGAIACGGGGAGSGYARSLITSVNVTSHTVAVGAGGTGGIGNGPAGGDTSLTLAGGEVGTAPLAKGGAGGEGGASVAAANAFAGGGNQAGGTGDQTSWGTPGGWGTVVNVATGNYAGNGGAGGFGFGGTINVKVNTGSGKGAGQSAPATSGGGGSGAVNGQSQTATNGGNGGTGLLRITEYRTLT